MKDNYSLISLKLVMDVVEAKGFYYLETERFYGEDYIGPEYIVATNDKDFECTHPEFEGMIILPVSKFIELVEVINDYTRNDMREQKRWERHHNEEGYYEEIPETDDGSIAPLSIKDRQQDPVSDEVESTMTKEQLLKAMDVLKDLPRKRLYDYYFGGLTFRQIAANEGVGDKTIRQSIEGAIKKLKKNL